LIIELRGMLRTAIELFYRTTCLLTYIDDIDPQRARSYGPLLHSACGELKKNDRILLKTLTSAKEYVMGPSSHLNEEIVDQVRGSLSTHSRAFRAIHEHLAYLPAEDPLPEASYVLEDVFGMELIGENPCVVLDSLFSAYEFDFLESLQKNLPRSDSVPMKADRSKVLALALCERKSPLEWAILAHEFGHALEQRTPPSEKFKQEVADRLGIPVTSVDQNPLLNTISGEIAYEYFKNIDAEEFKILRNWCAEYFADLAAAYAIGPTAILTILAMDYCFLPRGRRDDYSYSHPTTKWRLIAVSRLLDDMDTDGWFTDQIKEYLKALRFEIKQALLNSAERRDELNRIRNVYQHFARPISRKVEETVRSLGYPRPQRFDSVSTERCVKRLSHNRPIGAQGLEKTKLHEELKCYNPGENDSAQERKEQFYELADRFAEQPMPVSSILLAGYKHRFQVIQGFTKSFLSSEDSVQKIVSHSVDLMQKADDKLIVSIRSSEVSGKLIRDIKAKRSNEGVVQ